MIKLDNVQVQDETGGMLLWYYDWKRKADQKKQKPW
jgi:hypothetical protein